MSSIESWTAEKLNEENVINVDDYNFSFNFSMRTLNLRNPIQLCLDWTKALKFTWSNDIVAPAQNVGHFLENGEPGLRLEGFDLDYETEDVSKDEEMGIVYMPEEEVNIKFPFRQPDILATGNVIVTMSGKFMDSLIYTQLRDWDKMKKLIEKLIKKK